MESKGRSDLADVSVAAVHDAGALWRYSPILRGAVRMLNYLAGHGPIGLTPGRALQSDFVEWAAEVFDWPGFGLAELYATRTEIHEHDFLPLAVLHDLLLNLRLARHYKGRLMITRHGRALAGAPARLWEALLPELLFRTDHGQYMREPYQFSGDWEMILEIMNIQVHRGASETRICAALLDVPDAAARRDHVVRTIIGMYVLQPLVWAGLLAEIADGSSIAREPIYVKTPLWDAALVFPGSGYLGAPAVH